MMFLFDAYPTFSEVDFLLTCNIKNVYTYHICWLLEMYHICW